MSAHQDRFLVFVLGEGGGVFRLGKIGAGVPSKIWEVEGSVDGMGGSSRAAIRSDSADWVVTAAAAAAAAAAAVVVVTVIEGHGESSPSSGMSR